MTSTNSAGRDPNLESLIDDLTALRQAVSANSADKHVQDVAAQYLIANRALIERGFGAWLATSEARLGQLDDAEPILDRSAAIHDFEGIGREAMRWAANRDTPGGVLGGAVDDDMLHMLLRVMQYAMFLAETSDLSVQLHPVTEQLNDR
jgi:hypothetical protein